MKLSTSLALVALCGASLPALAGIVTTYDDRGAFLSATGSTSISGAIPNSGNVGKGPIALGAVTLVSDSGDLWLGTDGLGASFAGGWSSKIDGNELAISGAENFDIAVNLGGGVASFGFEMHEPTDDSGGTDGCNATCVDSTFRLSLFAGGLNVGEYQFNVDDDVLAFVGITSDTLFDAVLIREIAGGIDNEYFGQFYASVPEPGSLALLGAGLLGLGLMRRRQGA